tara:strand:+ start:2336 stop:3277 length:942 start_codon:yes stop_codon:yes gene_type:complete
MAKIRKPIPTTQRTLSKAQQKAFDTSIGNPNTQNVPLEQQTGITFNRGEKISFRDSTEKPFSIGIKDIDEAVFFYFNNIIQPFVFQNGNRREVPIIYAAPERWVSFQRDGYYRDKKGAIMLPIIVIKRDTVEKDRSVYNKLDSNQPNLYSSFQTKYYRGNFYSNFDVLNNRKPVKQYEAVAVPDFITLNYSCLMQTYYMEQLNKLIEQMEYASDSYWGDPERYQFRAFIDSFTSTTELTAGNDRLVKGNFNIRLRGYIIPDVIQKDLNSIKKWNSKSIINITNEVVTEDSNPAASDVLGPNSNVNPDGSITKE